MPRDQYQTTKITVNDQHYSAKDHTAMDQHYAQLGITIPHSQESLSGRKGLLTTKDNISTKKLNIRAEAQY